MMSIAVIEQRTSISQRAAELPGNYLRMKAAIKECLSVDECRHWSSEAAAAAAYFKMFRDKQSLMHDAERIFTRCRLRLKELLPADINSSSPWLKAGMTRTQFYQLGDALKVPRAQREALIDATPPASIAKLARVGNPPAVYVPQPGTGSAPGFAALVAFWKMSVAKNAADEAAKIDIADAAHVKNMLKGVESWLSEFERHMPRISAAKVS